MDLSKLPKLSQTPAPPPSAPVVDDPRARVPPVTAPGIAAEVWISAIVGFVVIMMSWNFARYLGATLTGATFHTGVNWTAGPSAGQEVHYFELQGFTAWTDAGLFIFGVAMVLEALVLLTASCSARGRLGLVGFSLGVTVLATALNAVASAMLFAHGILPLLSLLAVGFGGYIASYEWKIVRALRQ